MLTSIVSVGLHAVSVFIGGYLIYMFRKIADLPPDMNPLEDNLTSRSKPAKSSKHKYKNSDMSTLIGEGNDKRLSEISARDSNRTLCGGGEEDPLRMSQMSEKLMGVDTRASGVSFFQSRDGHAYAYSPHNPETARHSWQSSAANTYHNHNNIHSDGRSMYQQGPAGVAASTKSLTPSKNRVSRPEEADRYGTSRTMSPMPASMPRIAKRASATPASPIPIYTDSNSHGGVEEDTNWEVLSGVSGSTISDVASAADFDPYRYSQAKTSTTKKTTLGRGNQYESIAQQDFAEQEQEQEQEQDLGRGLGLHMQHPRDRDPSQPLRQNPPTPEPTAHNLPASPLSRLSRGYQHDDEADKENGRTQTMMSQDSVSQYSESDAALDALPNQSHTGQSKSQSQSRFYTDLASAMRGVRHQPPATKAMSVAGSVHTHLSAFTAASSSHHSHPHSQNSHNQKVAPATKGDLRIKPSNGTIVRKPLKTFDEGGEGRFMQVGYTIAKGSPSRVVSRSGVDEGDLGMMGRRRDVSGKVAEEGRAGGGGLWRRISGRHPSR